MRNTDKVTLAPVSALIKRLKAFHSQIKKDFHRSVSSEIRTESEQILYDNFYLLDSLLKQLVCVDKRTEIGIAGEFQAQIGSEILFACNDTNLPDSYRLCEIISDIQKERYVSNGEFDLLEWLFRYAVIGEISDLLKKGNSSERILKLLALLNKSDMLDTEPVIRKCSPIEALYSSEACGIYPKMDIETRKIYRRKTAEIAHRLSLREYETAERFFRRAEKSFNRNMPLRECHVGHYLFEEYDRLFRKLTPKCYITLLWLTPAVLSVITALALNRWWIMILAYMPFWELSKLVIEQFISRTVPATYLPRMDYKKQIPDCSETLAVISAMLGSPKEALRMKERLKSLYYANRSENLRFCILCDFKPSKLPTQPEDRILEKSLKKIISSLNHELQDRFIGIVRRRVFSATEEKFSGFDRKRGAIEQLVRLLHGEEVGAFTLYGDGSKLRNIKYLCALDYDTEPLMDTIPELVSIADHPLHTPIISGGAVRRGYGILAPRITTKLDSSLSTPFSWLFGGQGSSCAYDVLCGNLYQDAFREGIFAGKGLIHAETFYKLCCEFPEEQILSHDILEGNLMRTGFAGDVEFSDGFPPTAISYFKRLHRWIRGDIQNIVYICKKIPTRNGVKPNPMSYFGRFKLFDNIRRACTPIRLFTLLFAGFFLPAEIAAPIAVLSLAAIVVPFLIGIASSIFANGAFSLSRQYYSPALTRTKSLLAQLWYTLVLTPQTAVISADGIIRGLWRRFVSHKKLLEWTTAAQTEGKVYSRYKKTLYFALAEALSVALIFCPIVLVQLAEFIFSLMPLVVWHSDIPYRRHFPAIPTEKYNSLLTDVTAMWQFYEDYAGKEDCWLPPDNVQFAPVKRVCHRTSPTNIGMMLLSILAARDFDLIDTAGMIKRAERVITSVEHLEKYNGNLYNWYETKTLGLSCNPFVSSVDSGNFVCCLVALKEGLREFSSGNKDVLRLIARIEALIEQTDFRIFYREEKELFSIGIDPESGEKSPHHYDLLMSEARMLSYFAISKRLVPKKHWRALGRTMKRSGNFAGSVSYSGTMFEFFMPELLLKSDYGSLSYESLNFCVHCQKKRGRELNLPFGVSESGYYSFDNRLNYQYKAHGVQKIGLRNGLNNEYVVSPYSSYLAMQTDFSAGYSNLKRLKQYGTYGYYGHYEAIDFTADRRKGAIVKSCMAHHVGMSIIAAANVLMNGIFQKRFLNDPFMRSGRELLAEQVLSGSVITEDISGESKPPQGNAQTSEEFFDRFYPGQPNCKLLNNGEYSLLVTDLGATVSLYQGIDIFRRTTDLLRRPQGCYFAVGENGAAVPLTYLPCHDNSSERSVEFHSSSTEFYCNTSDLQMGMKVFLHESLPCEFREFAVKNTSAEEKELSLLCFLEPILAKHEDFQAHPMFLNLFLHGDYDIDHKAAVFHRKDRHSDKVQYLAVGFLEFRDFMFNFSREEVLTAPHGVASAFENYDALTANARSVPDPCIFLKKPITLSPKEQKSETLFVTTSFSKEELYQNIAKIRSEKHSSENSLPTPLTPCSMEERLSTAILPKLFFRTRDSKENDRAVQKNELPLNRLWSVGISGDCNIVAVEVSVLNDEDRLLAYMRCHKALKLCGVRCDLVFVFSEEQGYAKPYESMLKSLIHGVSADDSIGKNGGIFLVNTADCGTEIRTLILAAAVHIAPKTLVRIGMPSTEFSPMEIKPVSPADSQKAFWKFKNSAVEINGKQGLSWCHVLANPVFGTLLSHRSLGFTYALHSRENKLTPWFNDSMTDNRGELLLLKIGDVCYDLVLGSTAVFSESRAVYRGKTDYFESAVTVEISRTGCAKRISVSLKGLCEPCRCQLAYYTEPVLGVSRDSSRFIQSEFSDNTLFLHNPTAAEIKGFMAVSCTENCHATTDREAILKGDFGAETVSPRNLPCGTLIHDFEISGGTKELAFCLSFGAEKSAAEKMPALFEPCGEFSENKITIRTPDETLNEMFNHRLYNQALAGRMFARTGFHQNSGAFGFRDQLQDSCAVLLKNPAVTKQQIFRACTAQFPEGDVLHWWHKFPSGAMKGVRTRYSDDLLWLPYTVGEYLEKTSDNNILLTEIPFCDGEQLSENEQERYQNVSQSDIKENVYTHCKRAVSHALRFGEHGLLLMGCGDWNDGYNGVGVQGKGESVWLTEFMIIVLQKMSKAAEIMGEKATSEQYIHLSEELKSAVEASCWDGEWYLRAFFDSGEPMGSKDNEECKIDSLSQSFAELAKLPDKNRREIALQSAYDKLVDRKNGIIKLFMPPFSGKNRTVGYVSSYPQGVRENGGQYTHGAIWLCIAMLESGRADEGYELIRMLNPANRYPGGTVESHFNNEPYYLSADIYTNPQCYGRGGWSIYTGAAGWYYRAIFEWLLGIKINKVIRILPNIPSEWKGFSAELVYGGTKISVEVIRGENACMTDNEKPCEYIPIDGKTHRVRIVI